MLPDSSGVIGCGDGTVVLAESDGLVALVESAVCGLVGRDLFLILELLQRGGLHARERLEQFVEGILPGFAETRSQWAGGEAGLAPEPDTPDRIEECRLNA